MPLAHDFLKCPHCSRPLYYHPDHQDMACTFCNPSHPMLWGEESDGTDISVVIVGIDGWWDFTEPLLNDIERHAPRAKIYLIDNGSEQKYPISTYRFDEIVNYPTAINMGVGFSTTNWTFIINNDVSMTRPMAGLEFLSNKTIYGPDILEFRIDGIVIPYVQGWMYLVHDNVLTKVGVWDEKYDMAMTDDLDYSWRGWKEGINSKVLAVNPFKHLDGEQTKKSDRYKKVKQQNMNYFRSKHGFRDNSGGG